MPGAVRRACLTAAIALPGALLAVPAGPAPPPAARAITNSVGMRLALIPAGRFRMGSPPDEAERDSDETLHDVRIARPFYLGVYEVTQADYEAVRGENRSFFAPARGGGPNHPVEQVFWQEAVKFCDALSRLPEERAAGRRYRLPTEAEWEYACRAGSRTPFHFGRDLSSREANFDGRAPYGKAEPGPFLQRTTPAGSYAPNAFGVYDMHGNVQEWCSDWYDPGYYERSPDADPKGPPRGILPTGYQFDSTDPGDSGFYLVVRGGSWLDEARGCRSAYRFHFMPHARYRQVGFRVACEAPALAEGR